MRWGSDADVALIAITLPYIAFTLFALIKKEIVLEHLAIANVTMVVVFVLMLAAATYK